MIDSSRHHSPLSYWLAARRNWPRLLVWCLAGLIVAAAAPALHANQVYKACGQKWLRKAKSLAPEQRAWLMESRSAEHAVDLDGDGIDDTITMTSNPSFRDCQIKQNWSLKETTIRVELSSGKTRLFYWINDILAERMVVMRGTGRILVAGMNARGENLSKWVDYMKGAPPPNLVARRDDPGAFEGPQVASLAPQAVAVAAAVLEK